MTRSNLAIEDLHLSGSPITNVPAHMGDEYPDHRMPGWRQLLCAWFILLAIAALFKVSDVISANRTVPFSHTSNPALADVEQTGEIEHWERGEPRQWTMAVPNSHEIMLVSRIDQ
jgi:hypothetical protein